MHVSRTVNFGESELFTELATYMKCLHNILLDLDLFRIFFSVDHRKSKLSILIFILANIVISLKQEMKLNI